MPLELQNLVCDSCRKVLEFHKEVPCPHCGKTLPGLALATVGTTKGMADVHCGRCKGHLADAIPLEPLKERLLLRLLFWNKYRKIRDDYRELSRSWSLQSARRIRDEAGEVQPDTGISSERLGSALRASRQLVVERHEQLLQKHAQHVTVFLNKAQRGVWLDEYGDEVQDSVGDEIDRLIDKILERENVDPDLAYSIEFLARCHPSMAQCYSYWWLHDELRRRFFAHYQARDSSFAPDIEIDYMSGIEFEDWLIASIRSVGVDQVVPTKGSGDQGADVIVRHRNRTLVIQAKRYGQRVGNDSVQQAHAAKAIYGAHEAWVVTNSTFTKSAREAATHTGVRLVEGFQVRNIGTLVAESMGVKALSKLRPEASDAQQL